MKKILVTGAKGFVGKNLCLSLKNSEKYEVMEYDVDTEESLLEEFIMQADFLVHLAGVNRPKADKEFETGNHGFTSQIIDMLEKRDKRKSIIFSSSIHAERTILMELARECEQVFLIMAEETTQKFLCVASKLV